MNYNFYEEFFHKPFMNLHLKLPRITTVGSKYCDSQLCDFPLMSACCDQNCAPIHTSWNGLIHISKLSLDLAFPPTNWRRCDTACKNNIYAKYEADPISGLGGVCEMTHRKKDRQAIQLLLLSTWLSPRKLPYVSNAEFVENSFSQVDLQNLIAASSESPPALSMSSR